MLHNAYHLPSNRPWRFIQGVAADMGLRSDVVDWVVDKTEEYAIDYFLGEIREAFLALLPWS